MNLYEISAEIQSAWDKAVDQETGEVLSEEALELIDKLEMDFDNKVENIALWIKNLNAEAEAIKAEKLALAARQSSVEKKADSLKRYLASALGGNKFSTARVAVSFRKSEQVEVDEGVWFDDEYLTYTDPKPNKTAIKKALKSGVEITGARLVSSSNIQIK